MSYTTSEQPYLGSLAGVQQPETPTQSAAQALAQQTGPQTALGQFQYNLGQYQLQQVNPQLQSSLAYNNALAGNQQGQLGIQAQQQGIQGLGLQQQGIQAQQQQGIEQQQYGLTQGQFPEQQAEAQLSYNNALRGTVDSGAASGTTTTQGQQRQLGTLGAEYGFQQEDIARSQAQSQLGQQSEQSGYGYSQQQLQNAQQNLQLMGQANGLSQQQVLTMLNYGNQQQAVSAQNDVIGLLGQQANTAAGNLSNQGTQLSQIGFLGGVNALAGIG